jgi:hypothetical protein
VSAQTQPIVLGAQACGFGPVSKLAALARLLPGEETTFVGEGTSLDFVEQHRGWFGRIVAALPGALPDLRPLLGGCEFAVVVMDHELAFWVSRFGRPVYFFDSLFGFWVLHHPLADLVGAAETIRRQSPEEAHRTFHEFTVHERKVIAHLLARHSYVQNGPGVAERLDALPDLGIRHIERVGSIIDVEDVTPGGTPGAPPPPPDARGFEMLVNLGGVKNFILKFYENDYYIDVFERWARDFLGSHADCRRVVLCCGRYAEPRSEPVGHGVLVREFLPHDRFVAAVRAAAVYLTAPGLTAIHEAVQLGRVPVLLPEQHYSQFYNLATLAGRDTGLGELALGMADLFDPYEVPDDDLKGSEAIIAYARLLHADDAHYQRFRSELDRRVERASSMSGQARRAVLDHLGRLFEGKPLDQVVRNLFEDARPLRERPGDVPQRSGTAPIAPGLGSAAGSSK